MSTARPNLDLIALASIGGLLGGTLLWAAIVAVFQPPSYLLPSPSAVGHQLGTNSGLYYDNTLVTIEKVVVGGGIGALLGFVMGTAIAFVPVLRTTLLPYLIALRVLPKIAIAPVLLIYFGLGYDTAILYVVLVSFFPMSITSAAGYKRLPSQHHDLIRTVSPNRLTEFLRVHLPYALIDVFAGLKQTVALAVVGAIIAEWVVSTSGLGYLILIAAERIQTTVLLAALIMLFFVGFALYGVVALIQTILPYHLE